MEHLRRHVAQRRDPPQCERLIQQTDLDCGVGCPAGVLEQLIETHQIQLTSRERDQIAVWPGNNQPVAQPPTQPTHIRLCGSPSISLRSIPQIQRTNSIVDTTRLARNNSAASNARCLPAGTVISAPSHETCKGPRTRNSTRHPLRLRRRRAWG